MKIQTKITLICSFLSISALILAAGEVKINSNLTVEADGTLVSSGAATVWNDLNVFPDATTKTGSNPPVMTQFKSNGSGSQGVFLSGFSASAEQELYFTIQLPHGYKEGTTLYPHVHWTTFTGDPTGKVVEWALEYTIMKHGGTFGNTTMISSGTTVTAPTGIGQHTITALGSITSGAAPNDLKISTIIVCRLFRNAVGNPALHGGTDIDTYTGAAGLLGIDFHYESDMAGSRTDFEK